MQLEVESVTGVSRRITKRQKKETKNNGNFPNVEEYEEQSEAFLESTSLGKNWNFVIFRHFHFYVENLLNGSVYGYVSLVVCVPELVLFRFTDCKRQTDNDHGVECCLRHHCFVFGRRDLLWLVRIRQAIFQPTKHWYGVYRYEVLRIFHERRQDMLHIVLYCKIKHEVRQQFESSETSKKVQFEEKMNIVAVYSLLVILVDFDFEFELLKMTVIKD